VLIVDDKMPNRQRFVVMEKLEAVKSSSKDTGSISTHLQNVLSDFSQKKIK